MKGWAICSALLAMVKPPAGCSKNLSTFAKCSSGEMLVRRDPGRADHLLDLVGSLFRLNTVHHLQRASEILRDLRRTNRLNPMDEIWITEAEQRILRVKSADSHLQNQI